MLFSQIGKSGNCVTISRNHQNIFITVVYSTTTMAYPHFGYTLNLLTIAIFMPYPCSHFYIDIKFGDRYYSKEKRPGYPLLF